MFTKIAKNISNWDEYEEFGIELDLDINFVEQTKNEKDPSIRGCSSKLLRAFWTGSSQPNSQKWKIIRSAIKAINKDIIISKLGIDELCEEGTSQQTVQAATPSAPQQPHGQVSQDSEMPEDPRHDKGNRGFVPLHPSNERAESE